MNNLGYRLVINKVVKRKIDILTILIEDMSSISELSQHLGVTRKTLIKHFKELNQVLPQGCSLIQVGQNHVKLEATNYFEINKFIEELIMDNPLIEIIEGLFFGKRLTIEEYTDELFISETALRRYLVTLEGVLLEHNLSLEIRPLEILGSEIDIRYFYFKYFCAMHGDSVFHNDEKVQNLINKTISTIIKEYGSILNIDYPRLSCWMSIYVQRIKNGHFVKINQKMIDFCNEKTSYHRFKDIFSRHLEGLYNIEMLNEEELVFGYIVRLDTIIYESKQMYYLEDYSNDLAKFAEITSSFFEIQGLPPSKHVELSISIQALLTNISLLSTITPFFQQTSVILKKQMKNFFAPVYSSWMTILQKLNWEYTEDIATQATLITISYLQLHELDELKVLFALTGEPASINYYKTIALKTLPKGVESYFIFNKPITNQLLEALDIDLCVYNFTSPEELTVAKVIRISNVPSEKEWAWLASRMYD